MTSQSIYVIKFFLLNADTAKSAAKKEEGLTKKKLSVLKRHRQSERRRLRNRAVKSTFKPLVKKVLVSIGNEDREGAKTALAGAIKVLNKAASKGAIHKNTASRRISRLTKKVNLLNTADELPVKGASRPA